MASRHRPATKTRPAPQHLGENLMTRVPSGFHAALRRLVGQHMARTGTKIMQGTLLMELVEKALEQSAERAE